MIKHDLTGKTFGRLTVLKEDAIRSKQGYVKWICRCSCPDKSIVSVTSYNLVSGKTKSCGCLQKELIINRNKSREKHPSADRETRLYRIWKGVHARTTYESQSAYKNYGGRGIGVCDEWKNDFGAFRDWALANGYSDNLTIDRVDTNGDYTPNNCRWATRKEQNNNQRSNILLTFNGETHNAAQWADIIGVPRDRIYGRIRSGYPVERVLQEYIKKG